MVLVISVFIICYKEVKKYKNHKLLYNWLSDDCVCGHYDEVRFSGGLPLTNAVAYRWFVIPWKTVQSSLWNSFIKRLNFITANSIRTPQVDKKTLAKTIFRRCPPHTRAHVKALKSQKSNRQLKRLTMS